MGKMKIFKKTLNAQLNDSMRGAIARLELPKPTKKVKKLLDRSSKKLAAAFAGILRKQKRKSKKENKNLSYPEGVSRPEEKSKYVTAPSNGEVIGS